MFVRAHALPMMSHTHTDPGLVPSPGLKEAPDSRDRFPCLDLRQCSLDLGRFLPSIRSPQKGPEKWCRAKIVEKC